MVLTFAQGGKLLACETSGPFEFPQAANSDIPVARAQTLRSCIDFDLHTREADESRQPLCSVCLMDLQITAFQSACAIIPVTQSNLERVRATRLTVISHLNGKRDHYAIVDAVSFDCGPISIATN